MTEPIDLDHNARTPVEPRVLDRFVEVERSCPGNPGSLHAAGRAARAVVEAAREQVATALGIDSSRVAFVGGGTEANNLAVRTLGNPRDPVLLAPVEHPSVYEPAQLRGAVEWSVDGDGRARVEAPSRPCGLICLVHGQNELGTIQPIGAAGALAVELGVPLHVDCAQTLGRVPLDEVLAVATTVTLSAHKVGGLVGSSVMLSLRDEARPNQMLHGGNAEGGVRPGTMSPALAAATAIAIELAVRELDERAACMARARDEFVRGLDSAATMLTPADALPNTAMMQFDGVDGRALLPALDLGGVCASQGSACSTGSPVPPRVLAAIGLEDYDARRCVRFSFSHRATIDEARDAARRVTEIATRLRASATRSRSLS